MDGRVSWLCIMDISDENQYGNNAMVVSVCNNLVDFNMMEHGENKKCRCGNIYISFSYGDR